MILCCEAQQERHYVQDGDQGFGCIEAFPPRVGRGKTTRINFCRWTVFAHRTPVNCEVTIGHFPFQVSGEAMSQEDVKRYIAANEFAQRRHYTTTVGQGAELEVWPWFVDSVEGIC